MRVRTPLDVGLLIRDRRKQLGLSQYALGQRVGVGRHWIVAMEQGKSGAEIGLVLRTLSTLGLTLSIDRATPVVPKVTGRDPTDIDAIVNGALDET